MRLFDKVRYYINYKNGDRVLHNGWIIKIDEKNVHVQRDTTGPGVMWFHQLDTILSGDIINYEGNSNHFAN